MAFKDSLQGMIENLTEQTINSRISWLPVSDTKMEIDITLIPVQTRSQVSKQFSLKEFANGNLLKKGFW